MGGEELLASLGRGKSPAPSDCHAYGAVNANTAASRLDGQAFDEDINVVLVVTTDTDADGDVDAADKAATRDTEYTAILRGLTIKAGEVTGSQTISITPLAGGDKKIGLTALSLMSCPRPPAALATRPTACPPRYQPVWYSTQKPAPSRAHR